MTPVLRRAAALAASVMVTASLGPASITPAGRVAPPVLVGFEIAPDMKSVSLQFTGGEGLRVRDRNRFAAVQGGAADVPLEVEDGAEPSRQRLGVVSALGDVGWITVEYYPARYYESFGSEFPGVIQVVTDLPRATRDLPGEGDWQSTPSSVQRARQWSAWADLAKGPATPSGGSRLAQPVDAFMQFLDTQNTTEGRSLCSDEIPSGTMRSLIADGTCYAWCVGQAAMMRDLLRTAGFPSRRVFLRAPQARLPGGVLVQSSEQHASLEVFDQGRWRWIDPTFRVWEARGPDGTPLSLRGVFEALANPVSRNSVEFDLMTPSTAQLRTVTLANAPSELLLAFARYITTDKVLGIET